MRGLALIQIFRFDLDFQFDLTWKVEFIQEKYYFANNVTRFFFVSLSVVRGIQFSDLTQVVT